MIKDIFKIPDSWAFHDESDENGIARWINEYGDILSVNYFVMEPDIGADLNDLDGLRSFYRNMAVKNNIAPIEIETENLKGLNSVKTIYKLRQEPTGFAFLSSFTIPFSDRSFVIKIQSVEAGTTGAREAAVLMIEECTEVDEKTGKILGWERDPYEPEFKTEFMANRSDSTKYDENFPDHPLSRSRRFLAEISQEIEFDSELLDFKPFVFGKNQESKKWWEIWK